MSETRKYRNLLPWWFHVGAGVVWLDFAISGAPWAWITRAAFLVLAIHAVLDGAEARLSREEARLSREIAALKARTEEPK
jgi:hypothetical protein